MKDEMNLSEMLFNRDERLLDYITNLQDTLQDREEYIGHLEELCNKYEKEHSTTFNEWKETITDKYQTLKNLQEENEKLENDKRGMLVQLYKANNERDKYKEENERLKEWKEDLLKENIELENTRKKAIEYIMTELITEWDIKNDGYVSGSDLPVDAIIPLLNILNGGDEE